MIAPAVRDTENGNNNSIHDFKGCQQINSKGNELKAQQTPTQPCQNGVLDINDIS